MKWSVLLSPLKILLFFTMVVVPLSVSARPKVIQQMSSVPDFQRDPVKLLNELRSPQAGSQLEAVFDLELVAEEALGPGQLARLSSAQQSALSRSFKQRVAEELNAWCCYVHGPILQQQGDSERTSLLVLRGYELVRVRMVARAAAWFVVEVEDLDRDIPLLADALQDALKPGTGRATLLKIPEQVPHAQALKRVEALLAAQGGRPALLLLKALLVGRKQYDDAEARVQEEDYDEPVKFKGLNRGWELLRRIHVRWPDYAPALYAYATEDFVQEPQRPKVVAALKRYTQLRPLDPRGWYWLGHEQTRLGQLDKAENAWREAVRLAPADDWCVEGLFKFYLDHNQLPKLLDTLRAAARERVETDSLYYQLLNAIGLWQEEELRKLEAFLQEIKESLAKSKHGLRLLARVQMRLGKNKASLEALQQVLKLEPEAQDHASLAMLHRQLRHYEAAADAARRAIQLDENHTAAWFHLACALAQLGRREESIAALRRYEEHPWRLIGFDYRDEPDLQPLAELLEFKELTRKYASEATILRPARSPNRKARRKRE